jgi:DNA-binding transcriptional ArsR family regulator
MADPGWGDQASAVMAALRRQVHAHERLCRVAQRFLIELRLLTAAGFYVINRLHMMSRIQAKTDAFRAIADPTRRAILDRLRAGPANAGTLASDFQSSRPAVSRHLRVLREARLVVDTRIGRERVYAVNPVPLQSVAGWLEGYRTFWQASLTKLKRNLEAK